MTLDRSVASFQLVIGLKAGMRQTMQHGAVLMVRDQDDHPVQFQHSSVTIEVRYSDNDSDGDQFRFPSPPHLELLSQLP